MPQLSPTGEAEGKPLLSNMRRFLTEFQPQPEQDAQVTTQIKRFIESGIAGEMRPGDFTPEFWSQIEPHQQQLQADLKKFGAFASATLVHREEQHGRPVYRCKVDFEKAWVLQDFSFDSENKLAFTQSQGVEWKRAPDGTLQ